MKVFELMGEVYRKDSNSEQSEHGSWMAQWVKAVTENPHDLPDFNPRDSYGRKDWLGHVTWAAGTTHIPQEINKQM